MRSKPIGELALSILIFLAVLLVHLSSIVTHSYDSRWSIHTAMSILKEGNTDLDEYAELIGTVFEYTPTTEIIDGHVYYLYPIGSSLLAVPFVFAIDQIAGRVLSVDMAEYVKHTIPADVERFIACVVVALTAMLIYRIARLFLRRSSSLVLVFVFAFCSSAWSTASRGLWQHGPSMLMLTATLYLILRAKRRPALIQFASLPLAFSYVIRPTNSISLILLTAFVFVEYRRYFWRYLLWALPIAVPFVIYNLSLYHAVLPGYYRWYQSFSISTLPEALIGHLISPARGLFIYSPIFLLSILGAISKFRQKSFERLDYALISIILLHWIIVSAWPVWWGGSSFGPRILTDLIPYLVYWLIPAMAGLSKVKGKQKAAIASASLWMVGMSFFVHYRGANVLDVLEWDTWPVNVDWRPSRVWDLRDIQFLRGIKWGAPANVAVSGVTVEQFDVDTYLRLGTNDLRLRWFDVTRSLIGPPGEAWIAISDRQSIAKNLAPLLDGIAPWMSGRTMTYGEAYRMYYFDLGTRILEAARQAEHVAMWSPDLYPNPSDTRTVMLPAKFAESADLLGFQIITNVQTSRVKVITYWRAGHQVVTPLQLFVHALGSDGQIVAQEDRLDASPYGWREGDLIAQINRLTLPPESGAVWIQIGLYNNETGERLPVIINGQAIDQRLLLRHLELK